MYGIWSGCPVLEQNTKLSTTPMRAASKDPSAGHPKLKDGHFGAEKDVKFHFFNLNTVVSSCCLDIVSVCHVKL